MDNSENGVGNRNVVNQPAKREIMYDPI